MKSEGGQNRNSKNVTCHNLFCVWILIRKIIIKTEKQIQLWVHFDDNYLQLWLFSIVSGNSATFV